MAAQIPPLAMPALAHDGLVRSATARGAETAWAMMCLARIAMERGQLTNANLCLTLLCSQADTARTPVARRIRRDLPASPAPSRLPALSAHPPALGAILPPA